MLIRYVRSRKQFICVSYFMGGLLIDFVYLSIKDCKCNVNGSTGCHTNDTCICKENHVGRKCQQYKFNFIFKWLLIFLFYALNLINGFYAGSVFKEILWFLNMCILSCQLEKSSFSLGYSMFQIFTLSFYMN